MSRHRCLKPNVSPASRPDHRQNTGPDRFGQSDVASGTIQGTQTGITVTGIFFAIGGAPGQVQVRTVVGGSVIAAFSPFQGWFRSR